jgi:1,4-alpha-glucan branching enzyme
MIHTEMEAIVGGHHGDPFRILGPHAATGDDGREFWEVRAFQPHAQKVWVIHNGTANEMERTHPHGFFTWRSPQALHLYRLRVERQDGHTEEIDDAYRFPPLLTDFQLHLLGEGTHYEIESTLGAHLAESEGVAGVRFAVWAPNALVVSVVGDFNDWDTRRHPMRLRSGGVWELFIPGLGEGTVYKYFVQSHHHGYQQMKADPCGFGSEAPPKSGSVVANLDKYKWSDQEWLKSRAETDWLKAPMSIYEVHLGSWMRGEQHRMLTYRELAETLVPYVKDMGYTHVELLPPMEHPYSGSWGYQVIGYFAPTARHGTPEDFMHFVDCCHQAGIGVIVDWVPAHFPKDAHGLAYFDGTALYEHADPRKGEHRDWGTLIFNFGRNEVRSFLISSALFWLRAYHIDGLRVDAVASMLYLDYSREPGEWVPNMYGGNENLEAIDFLRRFNEQAHLFPGALTMAEESTAFTGVSRPVYAGGLGFTMKWNMGWMHDMLEYFSKESIHRKYHHNSLTFSLLYAFTENFILPVSHDEVVHGKRSLLGKMPGDEWQRFANARLFLGYMWAHPGKKLLFMGSELGQYEEWNHEGSVRWDLLQFDYHRKLQLLAKELNWFYRSRAEMHEVDFHWSGFEWVDIHDVEGSVISFLRWSEDRKSFLLFVCNFTPVVRNDYRIGVPEDGAYREVFNTDAEIFGGGNVGNPVPLTSEPVVVHGRLASIAITMPPLAMSVFEKV